MDSNVRKSALVAVTAALPFLVTLPASATGSASANGPGVQAAAPATRGYHGALHNGASRRCLDADYDQIKRNGTKVQLWDCDNKHEQWWNQNEDGSITNGYGRCLDADPGTINQNGTLVRLWDCNGGANQIWHYRFDGSLENGYSGRCLDADLNTIFRNGTVVRLWDCNFSKYQRWHN